MHRLLIVAWLAGVVASSSYGQDVKGTSTVTFGVGGGWFTRNSFEGSGGPTFNATYEYRLFRHLALDAGVHTAFSNSYFETTGISATILPGTNLTRFTTTYFAFPGTIRSETVPFGVRGIWPIVHEKGEFFLIADGAYNWSGSQYGYSAWAVQGGFGARFALDKQRHIWWGTTARYQHDFGYAGSDRVTWTADLSYRFGR